MGLRDAARASSVSRSFLHSWKSYPNLIITKETLYLKGTEYGMSLKISRDIARNTNSILQKHSGKGVKVLKLQINDFPKFSTSCDLNRWLRFFF
jgi:hypothetical protein